MIKRPLISEKSMELAKQGLYTFEIPLGSTKHQIARIVAEKFKVSVVDVKTTKIKGKKKNQRTRKGIYLTPTLKKALIKIKKGQKIPLFEQISANEAKVTTIENGSEVKEKKSLLKGTKVKIEKAQKKKEE